VPTHDGERAGRQRHVVVPDLAELDVQGVGDVARCVFVVLAYVEDGSIQPGRSDQLGRRHRKPGRLPCVDATEDGTDELLVTDGERLADQIGELQGSMLAMECFMNALVESLSPDQRQVVQACYASETAAFRTALMNSTAPEATVNAYERDVQRTTGLLGEPAEAATPPRGV